MIFLTICFYFPLVEIKPFPATPSVYWQTVRISMLTFLSPTHTEPLISNQKKRKRKTFRWFINRFFILLFFKWKIFPIKQNVKYSGKKIIQVVWQLSTEACEHVLQFYRKRIETKYSLETIISFLISVTFSFSLFYNNGCVCAVTLSNIELIFFVPTKKCILENIPIPGDLEMEIYFRKLIFRCVL